MIIKKKLMDVKEHLSNIKELCKGRINTLCFIDMDGIEKTILAKATFDNMQHMYDVLCFVESIQNKDYGFLIICKVLNQLNF